MDGDVGPPRPDDGQNRSDAPAPEGKPTGDKAADRKDDKPAAPMPRWKKALYWIVGLAVLAALVIGAVLYWLHARHFESTDDAFIDGHISQVSAQVSARVMRLAIVDNQEVKAGQVLLELDRQDFLVRLDQARAQRAQAEAQLAQSRAQLPLLQANIDQAEAQVRVAEADLGQAQTDLARLRGIDPKAITRQQLDTAGSTSKSAQARVDASRQSVQAARAQLQAQHAAIDAAEATVRQADVTVRNAELQLSYTTVVAPQDGHVAKRTVELGNYVNPGQALLAVVADDMWVTANFKETQLALMQTGQYVRVRIDACPDLDLDGRVDSFQVGSGSTFSALPAENATGNYVKVVQRLPVKIVIRDDRVGQCRLAPGLSVVPRVTVR